MRELVLTGLPALWPEHEEDARFLGPWCFAYHAKYTFEEYVNFSLVPPPPNSPKDIAQQSAYVADVCNRLLPGVAEWLNDVHRVDHSDRFWKIITINWLMHWVGLCHDRHRRLTQANDVAAKAGAPLRVQIIDEGLYRPGDWGEYNAYLCEHAYNLQIMSDLLRFDGAFTQLTCEQREIDLPPAAQSRRWLDESPTRPTLCQRLVRGVHAKIDRILSRLLARMNTQAMLGIIYGVSRWDKLRMQLALDPFIFFRNPPERQAITARHADPDRLLQSLPAMDRRNAFESAICNMLPSHLPTAFLTYYPDDQSASSVAQLWISDEIHGQLDRLYRTAHAVERGGRWIEIQHGGGHGNVATVGVEEAVYRTPDAFITWGWTDEAFADVTQHPLPSPMLAKLPPHRETNDKLLFIGTMFPAYHYRFHSLPQPEHLLDYMASKVRFFETLDARSRERVLYRPYLHDYGQSEIEYIRRHVPGCRIMTQGSVLDEMAHARLIVVDHPATTFLQALVMNAPLVITWDPSINAMLPSARPLFDRLREANILFDTPETAAAHINRMWPDVQAWWQSDGVQHARRAFIDRFARADRDWRRQWVAFLRAEMSDTEKVSG